MEMEIEIERLNSQLLSSIANNFPIGLFNGKMGLCIYFYWLSRWDNNEEYKKIADQFIEDILNEISPKLPISVENGLPGIILGFHHLINEQFIDGDINTVFEEVDHYIFHKIIFEEDKYSLSKLDILLLLYYLYIRLVQSSDKEQIYINEKLIILLLNKFSSDLNDEFFGESFSFSIYNYHLPVFLFVMGKLLSLDFYNYKVEKLLNEYSNIFLTRLPRLHSNRLFLLWGLLSIPSFYRHKEWNEHIQLLNNETDLTKILDEELKERKIFVSSGLSGIVLLLHEVKRLNPDHSIGFDLKTLRQKIIQSEAWMTLDNDLYFFNIHKGLFKGFPGVYLTVKFMESINYEKN